MRTHKLCREVLAACSRSSSDSGQKRQQPLRFSFNDASSLLLLGTGIQSLGTPTSSSLRPFLWTTLLQDWEHSSRMLPATPKCCHLITSHVISVIPHNPTGFPPQQRASSHPRRLSKPCCTPQNFRGFVSHMAEQFIEAKITTVTVLPVNCLHIDRISYSYICTLFRKQPVSLKHH